DGLDVRFRWTAAKGTHSIASPRPSSALDCSPRLPEHSPFDSAAAIASRWSIGCAPMRSPCVGNRSDTLMAESIHCPRGSPPWKAPFHERLFALAPQRPRPIARLRFARRPRLSDDCRLARLHRRDRLASLVHADAASVDVRLLRS